jgi:large subunit ribosomal protein L10
MSKKVKGLMQKELKSQFEGINECVVVSVRGIGGIQNNELRRDLLSKQIRINVVKNSLARRAFADLGMENIKDCLLGPSAIAYGGDSIVDVVKTLVDWGKKLELCQIKGAYLDGQSLNAEQAKSLAKLPNRAQLQGIVVMLAKSPGARVASAMGSPASRIAGCIKAIIEKQEAA